MEHIRPRRHAIVEKDSDENRKDSNEDEGFSEEHQSEEDSPASTVVENVKEVSYKKESNEVRNDVGSEDKDDDDSNEVFNDDSPFVEVCGLILLGVLLCGLSFARMNP